MFSSKTFLNCAAIDLAAKIFADLSKHSALLIGAGEMAELAIRHLINHNIGKIRISNRTFDRAVKTAQLFSAEPARLEDLPELLVDSDIVISSTGASGFIIDKGIVTQALKKRKQKPIFFIDIAVPRDVDPEIESLDNVYRYDGNRGQGC